ncbi:MAG: ABC transporter ATP-binding protein [Alphaproteobacteria bacterium]|nr:ABC transporter ATP-binding protein [Alphaproteobacteria bacterium]
MSRAALELEGVRRTFVQGDTRLPVLRRIDLAVSEGETVALIGPSGSGKTTLLQIAGLLDRPDAGEVRISGESASGLSDRRLSAMRARHLGFVFQFHQLLPEFSARENLVIPQLVTGRSKREARQRADALLATVGLTNRAAHRPARLSGGEQQRVAIARATANAPRLLLADEPTGNLDEANGRLVIRTFLELAHEAGVAALVATHNIDLARRLDRIVRLEDGVLQEHSAD